MKINEKVKKGNDIIFSKTKETNIKNDENENEEIKLIKEKYNEIIIDLKNQLKQFQFDIINFEKIKFRKRFKNKALDEDIKIYNQIETTKQDNIKILEEKKRIKRK